MTSAPHRREQGGLRILVANADRALYGLLEEWLAASGCTLSSQDGYDVIVVDVPFPRQGGLDMLKSLAREHPGTPIVALSANFLPCVAPCGSVARELGVASVLPKPVTREALIAAVEQAVQGR